MTMLRTLILTALMLCLAAVPAVRADKQADNALARADAARRVYEGLLAPNTSATPTGKGNPSTGPDYDQIYAWSLRWMQAAQDVSDKREDRISAVQAHVDRMRKLEDVVRAQREKQSASDADVAATQYFRLQAEADLMKLQAAK